MKLETNKSGYIFSKKSKKIQINFEKFGFYKSVKYFIQINLKKLETSKETICLYGYYQ